MKLCPARLLIATLLPLALQGGCATASREQAQSSLAQTPPQALAPALAPAPAPAPAPDPAPARAAAPARAPAPDPAHPPSTPASPIAASPDDDVIVTTGGELDLAALPSSTVERKRGDLIAWSLTELPATSRLQAALALADANARAELLTAIRVGLATSLVATSQSTSGAESQSIEQRTAQYSSGVLPALGPIAHGWRKLRRAGELLLQVAARISAREDALQSALAASLKSEPDPAEMARRALEHAGCGRALTAK